jgi:hypothetical protein
MTEARTVVADPALGCSYQIVLDKEARRTLVFQLHVPLDTSLDVINENLDKIGKAADRQIAWYELLEARENLKGHQRSLKGILEQRELLDARAEAEYMESNRKGPWSPDKLPPQHKQQRLALEQAITKYKEGIERWTQDEARCAQLVNGHVVDGGADRHAELSDR